MEFPVRLPLGNQGVLLHMITEPLAFFAGFRYYLFLRKKKADPISPANRVWVIIAAIFGALFGSRLLGGLENPSLIDSSHVFLHFYTNKTVLGGFLGGLFAVELAKKWLKEEQATGDLFVYPILLALVIGRIGCFSMGIAEATYGLPTDGFFGMKLGDGIDRHPVALYEIVFLLALWIGLKLASHKWTWKNGSLFKLFMIAYLVFRFLLDFIKPRYVYPVGLSAIQLAALLGLIWYLPFILQPSRLLVKTETE